MEYVDQDVRIIDGRDGALLVLDAPSELLGDAIGELDVGGHPEGELLHLHEGHLAEGVVLRVVEYQALAALAVDDAEVVCVGVDAPKGAHVNALTGHL